MTKEEIKQWIILILIVTFFVVGFLRSILGKHPPIDCAGRYDEHCGYTE